MMIGICPVYLSWSIAEVTDRPVCPCLKIVWGELDHTAGADQSLLHTPEFELTCY